MGDPIVLEVQHTLKVGECRQISANEQELRLAFRTDIPYDFLNFVIKDESTGTWWAPLLIRCPARHLLACPLSHKDLFPLGSRL